MGYGPLQTGSGIQIEEVFLHKVSQSFSILDWIQQCSSLDDTSAIGTFHLRQYIERCCHIFGIDALLQRNSGKYNLL